MGARWTQLPRHTPTRATTTTTTTTLTQTVQTLLTQTVQTLLTQTELTVARAQTTATAFRARTTTTRTPPTAARAVSRHFRVTILSPEVTLAVTFEVRLSTIHNNETYIITNGIECIRE